MEGGKEEIQVGVKNEMWDQRKGEGRVRGGKGEVQESVQQEMEAQGEREKDRGREGGKKGRGGKGPREYLLVLGESWRGGDGG